MVQIGAWRRPRALLLGALVLAWAGVLYWLSAQPASAFEASGLTSDTAAIPGRDYLVHAGLYFVLGALVWTWLRWGLGWSRRMAVGVAVGLAVLYGVFDEWHQSFVPGRSPDGWDVVADGVGALVAAISLVLIEVLWKRKFRSSSGATDARG